MALPTLPLQEVLRMNAEERWQFFQYFARYMPDAPRNLEYGSAYCIRIGSTTLWDADTMALRLKFEKLVKRLRRKQTSQKLRGRK